MEDKIMLEDGEEYAIIDITTYNNNKYVLLSNIANKDKVCVRKVVNEDDKVYICRLEDNELKEVLNLFVKENKDLL